MTTTAAVRRKIRQMEKELQLLKKQLEKEISLKPKKQEPTCPYTIPKRIF